MNTTNVIKWALMNSGVTRFAGLESFHYSNHAFETVLSKSDVALAVAYSYEDCDIDSLNNATEIGVVIESCMPGKFVFIDTGDYIFSDLPYADQPKEQDFETYDPNYHIYLVPKEVFEEKRNELDKVDLQWREDCKKRANTTKEQAGES